MNVQYSQEEESAQSLSNLLEKKYIIKQSKPLWKKTCLYDNGFKVIILGFIIIIAVAGYYIITKMSDGCSLMHEACNDCSYRLNKASKTIDLANYVLNQIEETLKTCPKKEEVIQAIVNATANIYSTFEKDCCNQL